MIDTYHVILYILVGIAIFIMFIYFFRKIIYETYEKKVIFPKKIDMSRENFPDLLDILEIIYGSNYKHLILDFKSVDTITHSAYMVILAQVEKTIFKKKKKPIILANRNNVSVLNILFNNNTNLYHKHFTYDRLKEIFPNKSKEVQPEITLTLEKDLRKIGIYDFYELNTIITELLGNAVEHGIKNKDINWWLHHRYDSKSKSVKISFVDMGIGIAGSYRKAGFPAGYKDIGDQQIIKDAMDGSLGSSTKDSNRGKGLPQILNMINKQWISDFILITNRVSVRYIDGKLQYQDHTNFVGTFYSFSVNINNYRKWQRELK